MAEEEIRQLIELTVKQSVLEFKRAGLLKDPDNAAYTDATEMLSNYYNSDKKDSALTYAIQGLRFDPYFKIIPMFFEEKKTVEAISEELGVDMRTIYRNKKRLCVAIYNELI